MHKVEAVLYILMALIIGYIVWWYVFVFVPVYLRAVDCHFEQPTCEVEVETPEKLKGDMDA